MATHPRAFSQPTAATPPTALGHMPLSRGHRRSSAALLNGTVSPPRGVVWCGVVWCGVVWCGV
eukprot:3838161-Prorocentrum_lima.AAC.1